jgi:hypothetical protein
MDVPTVVDQPLIPGRIDAYKSSEKSSSAAADADRPDVVGSATVIVATFAGGSVLGVAYQMNSRFCNRVPLDRADALFVERYGPPAIRSDIRETTLPMPYGGIKVMASRNWEWSNTTVKLKIYGSGDKLNSNYGYYIYAADLRLAAEAEQITQQVIEEQREQRRRQEEEHQRSRLRSLPQ